jgi:hypothetical protein
MMSESCTLAVIIFNLVEVEHVIVTIFPNIHTTGDGLLGAGLGIILTSEWNGGQILRKRNSCNFFAKTLMNSGIGKKFLTNVFMKTTRTGIMLGYLLVGVKVD